MTQCIYYKNKTGLTFNKREHIFPKAIGGIERLDNGVVSDQANEFFANNLEVKTLRTSEVFVGRFVNGYNKKPSKEKKKNRTLPEYLYNREIDSRTLGKIAFNVLAKIKGKDYVLKPEFDEFKNWIIGGNNDWYHCKMGKEIIASTQIMPNQSHYCVFVDDGEYLIADICLYNYWRKMFGICKKFDDNFVIPQGYICDWNNKREFTLIDLMHEIANEEEYKYLKSKENSNALG